MTQSHSEDYLKLNTSELMNQLRGLSKIYNDAYGYKLVTNNATK